MATHPSALKRQRQAERRRRVNRSVIRALKTQAKKVTSLAEAGKGEEAREALRQAMSALHRAARKGMIHTRNAARRIARLARRVAAAKPKS